MIKIYNNFIPLRGFIALLTLFVLWIRKEYKDDKRLDAQFINHERIHSYQQIELLCLGLLLATVGVWWLDASLWWLLAGILFPYVIYVLCWLIEIALPPYNRAYGNICFEAEAQYNEADLDYLKRRKLFTFRFLKYISNKKYPYLLKKERKNKKSVI